MNTTQNQADSNSESSQDQVTESPVVTKPKNSIRQLLEIYGAKEKRFGNIEPAFTIEVNGVKVNISRKPESVDVGDKSITINF